MLAGTSVKVGAQNMHWADEGAWTGEISPVMLKDCDLDIVELGHSERREHFGETDETVGLKTEAAVRHGLIPLICIGETLAEREAGRARRGAGDAGRAARSASLPGRPEAAPILLAYEPVWAIGVNGIPATSDYADARQAEIIAVAGDVLGRRVPCLYGGSVNAGNCAGTHRLPAYRRAVHRTRGLERRGLSRHPRPLRRQICEGEDHETCNCGRQRRRRPRRRCWPTI